jgi:hypothetical protein
MLALPLLQYFYLSNRNSVIIKQQLHILPCPSPPDNIQSMFYLYGFAYHRYLIEVKSYNIGPVESDLFSMFSKCIYGAACSRTWFLL